MKRTKTETTSVRKIIQIDPSTKKQVAKHATVNEAAGAVDKPNGMANILLCAGYNHLSGDLVRTAYGYHWQFTE